MKYEEWAEATMKRVLSKLERTAETIGASFPHMSQDGIYDSEVPRWWTNGFWPGILWLAYSLTSNEKYADIAKETEEKMDVVLDEFELIDHDAGFMWILSSGANYKKNCDRTSRCRLLKAASFLASRFNMQGNFIRAWNTQTGWAIIDCAMNLPLLYWAANELNDPRFMYIARAHADTVVKHFIREDGSVNHIVSFNPITGECIGALGGQGAAPDSAWSRGTAWAVYGMALAYRHLKDETYLYAAKRAANFFITNLPEDMVSHWDFRVKKTQTTPRDTSASACAACGLLEIAEFVGDVEGENYREKAYLILRSLTDNYSNLDDDTQQSFLSGGTVNAVINKGVNVGLIYGDYFYMEALSRLMGNKDIFWYSSSKAIPEGN